MKRAVIWVVMTLLVIGGGVERAAAEGYPPVSGALSGESELDASADVAFVVAVEDYIFLPSVPGARETARDWLGFFRDGLGVERTYDLVDQEVTRETLHRFAQQAAEDVGEGGTLWFVFVGHGAPAADGEDGLIVGVDAQQNIDSLGARGVRQQELMAIFEAGAQGQTVAVIDACFSGRDGAGETLVPGLQPVLPVTAKPQMAAKTVVLSAAQSDQFAGALPGAERPAFSYWMLGALRGWAAEDGEVRAADALEFTRRKLRSISDRVQSPAGFGDLDLVLIRGVAEADPLPQWDGRLPKFDRPQEEQDQQLRPAPDRVERPRMRRELDGQVSQETLLPSSLSARRQRFEAEKIFVRPGAELTRQPEYFQGSWANRLEGAEFYRAMGHDELAARYRPGRKGLAIGVGVAGPIAATVAGALIGSRVTYQDVFGATADYQIVGGLLGFAVGSLVSIPFAIWLGRDSHPVDAQRRLRMMSEYNQELSRRLQLDD